MTQKHLSIDSIQRPSKKHCLGKQWVALDWFKPCLGCKKKGSNNRYKARLKVAKVHAEISDARRDFLHKLTTRLVRENQGIAVEYLSVKNLLKNYKLALSISDASWGEIVRQLEYKCNW